MTRRIYFFLAQGHAQIMFWEIFPGRMAGKWSLSRGTNPQKRAQEGYGDICRAFITTESL